jgi:hypothetical protein
MSEEVGEGGTAAGDSRESCFICVVMREDALLKWML